MRIRSRLVLAIATAALTCGGLAYGGFCSGFLFFHGSYEGVAPTAAEKQKICDAIAFIRTILDSAGNPRYGVEADRLDKMKATGRLCMESGSAKGSGYAWTDEADKWGYAGDHINIDPDLLSRELSVIAGVLLHEMAHVCAPGSISREEDEACAYYVEFFFACRVVASSTATPAQKADAQKRLDQLKLCYLDFANAKITLAGDWEYPRGAIPLKKSKIGQSVSYDWGDGGSDVLATNLLTGAHLTINTGISISAGVTCIASTGQRVLIVSGTSGGYGTAKSYVDTTGDGLVEQATEAVIVPESALMGALSGLAMVPDGLHLRVYALELTTSKVWRLADVDDDGVPESQGYAYATPAQFPELLGAQSLATTGPAGIPHMVGVSFQTAWDQSLDQIRDHTWVNLRDTNGDGTADWSSGVLQMSLAIRLKPTFLNGVSNQQTKLMVHTSRGNTIQIYAKRHNEPTFTDFLGSAVANQDGLNAVATVYLNRPLRMCDDVIAIDVTDNQTGEVVLAETPPKPILISMSPDGGFEAGGTTTTITGENLPTQSQALVIFGDTPGTILSKTATEWVVISPAHPLAPDTFSVVPIKITCPGKPDARGVMFAYHKP